ncbi:MAG: hypothetical protein MPW14_21135 [Candidatus Manganitrophus sp.]|nr:MAG: hypothetical protein MPW14_21135 [Candidatus Manganitrophus sp.]
MKKNRSISHWDRRCRESLFFLALAVFFAISISRITLGYAAPVTGTKKVMVLRVHFADYAANSRYSLAQVQGFFGNLDTLWQNTSYSNITIDSVVSDLFQLPDDRSAYIDDFGDGDLSNGGKVRQGSRRCDRRLPGGSRLDECR